MFACEARHDSQPCSRLPPDTINHVRLLADLAAAMLLSDGLMHQLQSPGDKAIRLDLLENAATAEERGQ